jgi:eukaryotic-like serine/threonine-protein kinase
MPPNPGTPLRPDKVIYPRGVGRGEPSLARSLPTHLREQLPRRLRTIALLYSLAYFLSDFAPDMLTGRLSEAFRTPGQWIPGAASILAGLMVAGLASSSRVSWQGKMYLGLVFEVLGSYGIALSMYVGAERFASTPIVFFALAPSWVAIWMIVYSIVVPATPGRALIALLASASAAPLILALSLQRAGLSHVFTPEAFFLKQILPYLTCVLLAYAGARIVVTLGADVSRARELGSYRLIECLGEGGMGEVWRASHRLLARDAAIKFIRPETILERSPEALKTTLRRFELEAKSTASLTSEHTVELYDFGVTDDGTFYYVMELLEGLDCDRLVRKFGALPPSRVVHLMIQVCESLEEAHEKRLIHRDVKPANVYVCRSGIECDFVKVLDFGLVTQRRPAPSELMLTPPEHAIGTPAFMAPEAAQGREVDGRSDLYGVGCVAYWLVTGRWVFQGSGFLEVVSKHLHAEPEPPSRHAPGEMPPELDALILRCLEKTPERRPSSARELARLLRSVPLRDPWTAESAEAWWAEHLPSARA